MLFGSHRLPRRACHGGARAALARVIGVMILARAHDLGAQGVASNADSADPGTARPPVCDTTWTTPRELRTPLGHRVYVEAPVAASDARGRYLFGTPTFVWAAPDSFATLERPLPTRAAGVKLVGDWSAVPLPALPGSFPQYTPLPITHGADLLVLWATSRDTTSSGFSNQDTLWESRLIADRWSTPRAIYSAGEPSWHPGTVALTTVGSTVVAAFPARDTTRSERSGLVLMSRTRDGWRTRWFGLGNFGATAVALLPLTSTDVLIVATGGLHRPPMDAPQAVYAIRMSATDTADRPRISIIREFDHAFGVEPSVFRSSSGIHAVWRQPGIEIADHDSIVEATSADMGATWTATSAASLETNVLHLSALTANQNEGVGAALDIQRGMIITLRRSSRRWLMTRTEFPEARTMPKLSQSRNRMALMFARTARSRGPEGSYDAPVLLVTSRALRCESPPANRSRNRLRAPPRGESTLE